MARVYFCSIFIKSSLSFGILIKHLSEALKILQEVLVRKMAPVDILNKSRKTGKNGCRQ